MRLPIAVQPVPVPSNQSLPTQSGSVVVVVVDVVDDDVVVVDGGVGGVVVVVDVVDDDVVVVDGGGVRTAHICVLQACVSISEGQVRPPSLADRVTVRVLDCVPLPQGLLQVSQLLQSLT